MHSAVSARAPVRLLVIDPDHGFRRRLREAAARAAMPVEIREAACPSEAGDAAGVDAAVLAEDDGGALAKLAARAPVIVVSGSGALRDAVAAMRAGAADYLVKPVNAETVLEALARIRADAAPPPVAGPAPHGRVSGFVGHSGAMCGVRERIARIAPSRAPVCITGESGTGKELAAESVHLGSGRDGDFVAVNCAAIPRELMESELFGHARGAFTGAHEARPGAAELSDGGTLFLDEICEMETGLQTKLLRFVQSQSVRRIGEGRPRPVDVRIVCATNRDPAAEVAAGRFREDLYYRLHVLTLHLPPLRERSQDVAPLAEAFLAECAAEEDRRFTAFDARAKGLLASHDWPGNVRELQNVVRRAVVMNDGDEITAEMLALAMAHAGWRGGAAAAAAAAHDGTAAASASAAVEPYRLQERRIIERALDACGGHVGRAAAALEISPSTIYRKMQGWQAA